MPPVGWAGLGGRGQGPAIEPAWLTSVTLMPCTRSLLVIVLELGRLPGRRCGAGTAARALAPFDALSAVEAPAGPGGSLGPTSSEDIYRRKS